MRDVKFRVWSSLLSSKREMLFFTLKGLIEGYGNDCPDGDDKPYVEEGDPVMQYTGLKDKNGKEICEGIFST